MVSQHWQQNVVPRQHWAWFFLYYVVSRELRQSWTGCFLEQCCLEPQGQHWIEYLLEQYCPKSIKTTLSRIFSCEILSESSWVILHRFLLAYCCPKVLRQHWTGCFSVHGLFHFLSIETYGSKNTGGPLIMIFPRSFSQGILFQGVNLHG